MRVAITPPRRDHPYRRMAVNFAKAAGADLKLRGQCNWLDCGLANRERVADEIGTNTGSYFRKSKACPRERSVGLIQDRLNVKQ
jgi:hypothetical protein